MAASDLTWSKDSAYSGETDTPFRAKWPGCKEELHGVVGTK